LICLRTIWRPWKEILSHPVQIDVRIQSLSPKTEDRVSFWMWTGPSLTPSALAGHMLGILAPSVLTWSVWCF
jgi:hypothetical protein